MPGCSSSSGLFEKHLTMVLGWPYCNTEQFLVRRYQRYADLQGWKVQFMAESESEGGGYKECVLQVSLRQRHGRQRDGC